MPSGLATSGAAAAGLAASSFGFSSTEPVMSAGSALLPPGKLKVSCAQDCLVDLRLVVEHVAAVDHEAGDLQHGKADDRDQRRPE